MFLLTESGRCLFSTRSLASSMFSKGYYNGSLIDAESAQGDVMIQLELPAPLPPISWFVCTLTEWRAACWRGREVKTGCYT